MISPSAFKDVHLLSSRRGEYIILYGKKAFAEVITDLEKLRLFRIVQGAPV